MSFSLRFASVLMALALPGTALAVPPAGVTGVTAELQNGKVMVSWNAVPDPSIAAYRVYMSRASILQNDGAYDDFETTPGPENILLLQMVPPGSSLYVSVLAVNDQDEESTGFMEEAMVQIPGGSAAPQEVVVAEPTPAPVAPVVEDTPKVEEPKPATPLPPLTLLSAQAVSATGIALSFSAMPTLDMASMMTAIVISDASGAVLPVIGIDVQDKTMIVRTETQERGKIYEVKLAAPLMGANGAVLDTVFRVAFVAGHATGVAPRPAPQPTPTAPTPTAPVVPVPGETPAVTATRDVQNLILTAALQPNGYYTVKATWTYDNTDKQLAHYVVSQSRDKGATYGNQTRVPIDVAGIELVDVDPGDFGLAIQTVSVHNQTSRGIFQTIPLRGPVAQGQSSSTSRPVPPLGGTVVTPPTGTKPGGLPQSGGVTIALSLVLAGGVLGLFGTRKLLRA